jgi:HEAT repeat protein
MNFLRRFQAGRYAQRLQASGMHTDEDVASAREELLAIGPAAIRAVFDSIARGRPAEASVEVLERLLDNETLSVFMEALRSPVPAVVDAATMALSRSAQYDPTQLLPLFSDARVPKSRLEVVLGAQMKRLQPVTLVRLLPDLSKDSRGSVFRLIENSADSSVVQDTVRLATHAEWWLRLHAVKLLAKFPSDSTSAGVARLLNDENPAVRLEAVRALGQHHALSTMGSLCQRLRDADVRVQTAAIQTLIAMNEVAAVPFLLEYLKDENEYVRRGAVEVLNEVVTPEAVKDLVEALRDSDWWVRVRAADALGSLGGPKVIDAVITLVKDNDEYVRRYAVEILNMVPDRRAVEPLIEALKDPDWWVRERAIDALAKTGDRRAVEPLLLMLGSDSRCVPLCVKALANIPDSRSIGPLMDLVDSDDAEIRREALVALQRLAAADLPQSDLSRVTEILAREGVQPGGPEPSTTAPSVAAAPGAVDAGRVTGLPPLPPLPASGRAPTDGMGVLNVQRLEPGTILGKRFQVQERIGGGGFGTVYRVRDVIVNEEIVLKVLSPQLSLDETMIRRFVQELRLSRRITHPNVIRIHDLIDLNGAHAISMEYFAGRDLGAIGREQGALPLPRLLSIARQVLDGLSAAHALGIIHRDIKPANILLGDDDLVKIVDFGLASVGQSTRSRLTQSGILVGTPEYISPEQITGQSVDGRTDLYSLGVVLWELASGKQPFSGPNAVNVLFQHLEPNVPRIGTVVPGLPPQVDEFITSCMARQPDDRPADVDAALEMLARAAAA